MNVTLDDTHPQLVYEGDWLSWRPVSEDGQAARYFRETFHSVYNEGASVSLTFNGTAAWFYGSYWLNHGAFTGITDGGEEITKQGYYPERQFQGLLYETGQLENGQHEVRLTNRPNLTTVFEQDAAKLRNDSRLWFDLDYVVVQLPLPETGNVSTYVIDDTESTITHSTGWDLRPQAAGYYNGTTHSANSAGAGFALPFIGSSIQLFGTIGPDVGQYTVSIDGEVDPARLSGAFPERKPNSPLFFISGLEDKHHLLNFVSVGSGTRSQSFEFDYAVVNSTVPRRTSRPAPVPDVTSASSTSSPPAVASTRSGPMPSSNSTGAAAADSEEEGRTNVGAIAGSVVGALAALGLLAVLLLFWRRHQKHEDDVGAGGTGRGGDGEGEKGHSDNRFVSLPGPNSRIEPFPMASPFSDTDRYDRASPVAPRLDQLPAPSRSRATPRAVVPANDWATSSNGLSIAKRGFEPASNMSTTETSSSPTSEAHPPMPVLALTHPDPRHGHGHRHIEPGQHLSSTTPRYMHFSPSSAHSQSQDHALAYEQHRGPGSGRSRDTYDYRSEGSGHWSRAHGMTAEVLDARAVSAGREQPPVDFARFMGPEGSRDGDDDLPGYAEDQSGGPSTGYVSARQEKSRQQ